MKFSSRRKKHSGGGGDTNTKLVASSASVAIIGLTVTALLFTANECDALRRKPPRSSLPLSSTKGISTAALADNDNGINSPSLNGFPLVHDRVPFLESSIFLYRGGSASSNGDGDDSENAAEFVENSNNNNDEGVGDRDIDQKIHTEESNIQVTSTVASASSSDDAGAEAGATIETSTHTTQSAAPRKKSNAVGDPDGNSSDDETSDEEEEDPEQLLEDMEKLNEFEKELLRAEMQKQGTENELETLVEIANKREGMKKRIAEMEGELRRRRGENAADDAVDGNGNEGEDGETDIDAGDDSDAEESNDEEENASSSTATTSYHMAGTEVAKEDAVEKRQRKYKRGSIFKNGTSSSTKKRKSSSGTKTSSTSTSTNTSSTASKPPAIPTNINSQTLDTILISAFQSMIFLPPPSPRLPSIEGSTSLRNVDVSSRRRLDRRTLYHGLLAELGGSHHHNHGKDAKESGSKDGATAVRTDGASTKKKKDGSVDSMIRRRYLDAHTSRSLKGALSLACQPKWRERLLAKKQPISVVGSSSKETIAGDNNKEEEDESEEEEEEEAMPSWWYRGGVCLFPSPDDDDDESNNNMMMNSNQRGPSPLPFQRQQSFHMGQQNMGGPGQGMGEGPGQQGGGFFGPPSDMMNNNPDEDGGAAGMSGTAAQPWRCTMSQQETVAMALAHSLSCGLALIDDEALDGVRKSVEGSLAELAKEVVVVDDVPSKEGGNEEKEEGEKEGDVDNVEKPMINPEELRNSALIGHLVRLSEEGKLGGSGNVAVKLEQEETGSESESESESRYGRISHRMKRDMELGLDDPNDELAVESLRLMQEDERQWFEPIIDQDNGDDDAASDATIKEDQPTVEENEKPPMSLVLFLRSDSSPSILRSKSAVETLAQECVRKDGIHLLVLGGRGIDAGTTTLSGGDAGDSAGGGAGMAKGRMNRNFQRQQSQQQGGGSPFAFMSNFPPGSPEFNAQMMQQQQQQQNQQQQGEGQFYGGFNPNTPPGTSFSAQNANASGLHDPEGSKRFNIFLARTVDYSGRPQILGTIAPPNAGNLFPVILRNMAKENLRKMDEQFNMNDDEEDEEASEQKEAFRRQMEELASSAEAHMMNQQQQEGSDSPADDAAAPGMPNAVIFNATITSPFGAEIFNRMTQQNDDDENQNSGGYPMPPENVRRAIQDAMSGVIDRLAQMSAASAAAASSNSGSSNSQGPPPAGSPNGIPLSIARAFSQVLSNENLRRGISENLSRAAPALVDPRCQGVMLSVYVPPDNNHRNRGMMPGDQYKDSRSQQGQSQDGGRKGQPQQQQRSQAESKGDNVPHGMGGWLNKILSSSEKGKQQQPAKDDEDAEEEEMTAAAVEEEGSDETSEKNKVEESAATAEKESSAAEQPQQQQDTPKSSKSKKGKREKSLDRARTLAVAAAALAGSTKSKNRNRENGPHQGSGGASARQQQHAKKLTPAQKAQRNLLRLQTLCRHVPLPSPVDPVRQRSWESWADRESGSMVFRENKRALLLQLVSRNLGIDVRSGTRGAGVVLRQMMSVRDLSAEGEMEDVIRCAVEIEAGKSQRHNESPWGVMKPSAAALVTKKSSPATDKSLVNFLTENESSTTSAAEGEKTRQPRTKTHFIHPNSLESALSLVSGVSPQGTSSSPSSSGALASHRSKEDLMALAQDKHERALIPNCASPQDIGVSYDMIGGLNEVKELLRQSITYPLKFPHLYSEGIAREAVKGVLLFGPPGTGKTMLAKAVATEGGASFLSVDASSVENKWLGESEKNAKAVFTLARRLAPCVIFIDEVDSLLSSREGSGDDSAHGTLTSVKTTMMSEWDGLNSGTNGRGDAGSDRVVVIGSTNRPFDLDEAVLRRFPRRILVDLPDLETRREILEVTLAENRLGGDVNMTKIAERLEGYTGSDLKEVCREAVVQISHEQARMLDRGELFSDSDDEEDEESSTSGYSGGTGGFQTLRPVTMQDFENAMRKLKRSVSETGRELAKVWDWNDEYGEIKKTSKRDVMPQMMNMFL